MEVFSLEEDDCPELFITQSGSSDQNNGSINEYNDSILGDGLDFKSPCASLVRPVYSDISEDEDFTMPLSQKRGLPDDMEASQEM